MSFFTFSIEGEKMPSLGECDMDDELYDYIYLSFDTIESVWVDGIKRNGFDYCGVSTVEKDIKKLIDILLNWQKSFELLPNTIDISTSINPQTGEAIPCIYQKKDIINQLTQVVSICQKAIEMNKRVVVFGL
ncbi:MULTISPECIES: hypothetical protein [Vagococcus]|uniref:Uncharacterized protein n=1 Tax=Vagococcus fluvialis bH819 TaxID=1255619 RepID=A0A1X6WKU8_9ENTE|nr:MULTISPECIES: hypothetical protein [Vagococcus]SLM84951.1 hypothetical protein FM121_02570 [Vagococcus fluvialis bH819]HCM90490.1 hypothetical protein [Vagococcus sp.]